MKAQIEQYQIKIEETINESNRLFETAKEYEGVVARLTSKRIEANTMRKRIAQDEERITAVIESDEELLQMEQEYRARMGQYDLLILDCQRRDRELEQKLRKLRSTLGSKLEEQGKLEAEKSAHERQVVRREQLVKELSRKHGFRGFDSQVDEDQIRVFIEKLSQKHKEQNEILESIKQQTREEIGLVQTELNHYSEKRTAAEQKRGFARSDARTQQSKKEAVQRQLDAIAVDDGQEAICRSKLQDANKKLQTARDTFDQADFDQQTRNLTQKLRAAEEKSQDVTQELAKSTKQADIRARLDLLKKEFDARQVALDSIIEKNRPKLDAAVGAGWTVDSVEGSLDRELKKRIEAEAEAVETKNSSDADLTQLEAKRAHLTESLKRKKAEVEECKVKVETALQAINLEDFVVNADVENYQNTVSELEGLLKDSTDNLKSAEFYIGYFNKAVTGVDARSECILCRTKLPTSKCSELKTRVCYTRSTAELS